MSVSCWRLFSIRVSFLNISSGSCFRCPPGQFSFIPHKVDFKESLSRGLTLQMEPRMNRPARATTAQGFCWVFFPRDTHVVHQDSNSAFQQPSLSGPFHQPLFYRWKQNLRSKRTERGSMNWNSHLPPLCPHTPRYGHEKELRFISVRLHKMQVKSTLWNSSDLGFFPTQSSPQCVILGRLLHFSKPVFLHVKWG